MAPKPPTAHPSHSSRPTLNPSLKNPYQPPQQQNLAPTKRHKQHTKYTALLSRLSATSSPSRITKPRQRRRPSKKLATNLDDLADALPETITTTADDGGVARVRSVGKIKHKSLKSRHGAQRKKEKVVRMEMERFGRNMALMFKGGDSRDGDEMMEGNGTENGDAVGKKEGGERGSGSRERWKAIRGFIAETMERRDEWGRGTGDGG